MNYVQEVFRLGYTPFSINKTFMVLIPKNEGVANFNSFILISLCIFTYKVIEKFSLFNLKI